MASVSLSLEEYNALLSDIAVARQAAADANETLQRERLARIGPTAGDLLCLIDDLTVIVRFAVANLPPSEIKNWPWGTLRMIADGLDRLPDHTSDDAALAKEFRDFARLIEDMERSNQYSIATCSGGLEPVASRLGRPPRPRRPGQAPP